MMILVSSLSMIGIMGHTMFQGYANNNKPFVTYSDAYHRHLLNRDMIQQEQRSYIHDMLKDTNGLRLDHKRQHRQTQDENEMLCNTDGTVNVDDDFNINAFSLTFQPDCTCSEDENVQETFERLTLLLMNATNPQAIVDEYNREVSQLYVSSSFSCENDCESCWTNTNSSVTSCGIFTQSQTTKFSVMPVNFTLDEILNMTTDSFTSLFTELEFDFTICNTYSQGQSGEICFSGAFEGNTESCEITYNDVPCNSCTVGNDPINFCVIADCTNIDPQANIDNCAGTGLVGPFEFIAFSVEDTTNTTFTIGTCDGNPIVPVAAPAPAPISTPTVVSPPVTSPTIVSSPISSPMTSPSTPAPFVVPVAVPNNNTTPVVTPTSPMIPLSTPVRQPVNVPAPSTPTTSNGHVNMVHSLSWMSITMIIMWGCIM